MDILEKIIRENCWKFDKGYPDSQKDINYLITLIEQQLSIPFTPEEYAGMLKKDTGIDTEDIDTSAELFKTLKTLDPRVLKKYEIEDEEELKSVANAIMNARLKKFVFNTLKRKGWNEGILKAWSDSITPIFRDIDDKNRDKFISYLDNMTVDFAKNETGNFYNDFQNINIEGLPLERLVRYTAQDEKKLGVGMGEVALTMLFNNVQAAQGGGDLFIDKGKFEIKGYNAKLDRDPSAFKAKKEDLAKLGINRIDEPGKQTTMFVGDSKYKLTQLSSLLSDLHSKSNDKEQFIIDFKEMLANVNLPMDAIDARVDKINWSDPNSIQKNVSLINFIRYATKEGFTRFLAHDTGSKSQGSGNYVYVSGSPTDMAQDLYDANVQFQDINVNTISGPRIRYNK